MTTFHSPPAQPAHQVTFTLKAAHVRLLAVLLVFLLGMGVGHFTSHPRLQVCEQQGFLKKCLP